MSHRATVRARSSRSSSSLSLFFRRLRYGMAAVTTFLAANTMAQDPPVGYDDTPDLPGQSWRVHDGDRPRPAVVTPGARFSEAAAAPSDALVLFDGTDLSHWKGRKGPAAWKVENGYVEVVPGTGDIQTRDEFGDLQLHMEWSSPAKVESSSQGRGNSGVFLHGRYEVQVLDSYDNPTYADGQAGALYGQTPPLRNATRPPGEWQTYDIFFEAARFDGDRLLEPARVTVIHNGVLLHHKKAYFGPTLHKRVADYSQPIPARGPISLQDHGNPMRFRNLWIRPLGEYDEK